MVIQCTNWLLIEKFKKEREVYEEYNSKITKEKIAFAKSKLDTIDMKILNTIYKLRICTSKQLSKIVYKDSKFSNRYINNKLKKLFELGCIDRFFPSIEKGSSPVHVVLASIGAKILEIKGFRKMIHLNQKWRHTVYTNDILATILLNHRVKSAKFELWLCNNDKFKIRCDMFCGWVKETKLMYSIFEIDMGTEHMSELYNKIKKYHEYFNSEYFKKAEWQPHKDKDIAIIPSIYFIFNDNMRLEKATKYMKNFNTNINILIQSVDSFKI